MYPKSFLAPPNCRSIIGALLVASLITAGGCAQIPSLGEPPALNPVAQLGSAKSLSAPAGDWPSDRWWEAYDDPQLDRLIEEAL